MDRCDPYAVRTRIGKHEIPGKYRCARVVHERERIRPRCEISVVEMFIANRGNSDLEIDRPVNLIRVQLSSREMKETWSPPSFIGQRLASALNSIYLSSFVCAWAWLRNVHTHEQLIKREKHIALIAFTSILYLAISGVYSVVPIAR